MVHTPCLYLLTTFISSLVQRAELVTQKMLKRSLGDRTFRRDEIAMEIRRICADVDMYLNVHVVSLSIPFTYLDSNFLIGQDPRYHSYVRLAYLALPLD